MDLSNSSAQRPPRSEISDSDDDSPVAPSTPEHAPPSPHPSAISTLPSTTSKPARDLAAMTASINAANPSLQAPSPSPRSLELQRKTTQLRSTIETIETQLGEALSKLSTLPSFQQQSSTTSPTKATFAPLNAVPDLSPDEQHTLRQAQRRLDKHIQQLGQYNQLKDIAMGMLGMIAEKEGKMLREVMEARDVKDDD